LKQNDQENYMLYIDTMVLNTETDFVDRYTCSFYLSIYLSIYLCIYMCVYWSLFVFYFRSNTSVPSPPSEINEISSSSNQQTKSGITLNRQTSEELNAQQGKRKFSLSQYKEHKRLRSNELQNSLADTDMRINNMGSSKVKKKTKISNYYSYEF
jgi:hypothetical protein